MIQVHHAVTCVWGTCMKSIYNKRIREFYWLSVVISLKWFVNAFHCSTYSRLSVHIWQFWLHTLRVSMVKQRGGEKMYWFEFIKKETWTSKLFTCLLIILMSWQKGRLNCHKALHIIEHNIVHIITYGLIM